MTFRNKLIAGFRAALCILLIIGALSYQRFPQEESDQKWAVHSKEVLEQLDAALAALARMEIGHILCGTMAQASIHPTLPASSAPLNVFTPPMSFTATAEPSGLKVSSIYFTLRRPNS